MVPDNYKVYIKYHANLASIKSKRIKIFAYTVCLNKCKEVLYKI